jgi:putative ABC transport system ATP-binding protein
MLEARDITKVFRSGAGEVMPLKGINVDLMAGELTLLMGPSGSGKTTLLSILGCILSPTGGSLNVAGRSTQGLSAEGLADLRRRHIGFVFQAYNLVPVLNAVENVEFVLELQGKGTAERRRRALEVLAELGLADLAHRLPSELSGGQQQRVAVARAVASRPELVLADEPTANLDSASAEQLMGLMRRLHEESGMTFVFSTHDPRIVAHATRVVTLEDGKVVQDEQRERASP